MGSFVLGSLVLEFLVLEFLVCGSLIWNPGGFESVAWDPWFWIFVLGSLIWGRLVQGAGLSWLGEPPTAAGGSYG